MHQIASGLGDRLLHLHDLFVKCPGVEESIMILKLCTEVKSTEGDIYQTIMTITETRRESGKGTPEAGELIEVGKSQNGQVSLYKPPISINAKSFLADNKVKAERGRNKGSFVSMS
jgi:hypothetical protein